MNKRVILIGLVLLVSVIGVIAVINTSGNNATIIDLSEDTNAVASENIESMNTSTNMSAVEEPTVLAESKTVVGNKIDSIPENLNIKQDRTIEDIADGSDHVVKRLNDCTVEQDAQKCKAKGYQISKYNLDTNGYACSVDTANKGSTVITCDSITDGNGDGNCTSGETCIQYVISKNSIKSYEKNSRDTFVEHDNSFFLDRAKVTEVAQ